MAAHLNSSSSSSCLPLRLNTSGGAVHTSRKLPEAQLLRLLVDLARSSPAKADAIATYRSKTTTTTHSSLVSLFLDVVLSHSYNTNHIYAHIYLRFFSKAETESETTFTRKHILLQIMDIDTRMREWQVLYEHSLSSYLCMYMCMYIQLGSDFWIWFFQVKVLVVGKRKRYAFVEIERENPSMVVSFRERESGALVVKLWLEKKGVEGGTEF